MFIEKHQDAATMQQYKNLVTKLQQTVEIQNDRFIQQEYSHNNNSSLTSQDIERIKKVDTLDIRLKNLENNNNDILTKLTEIEENNQLLKELNFSLPTLKQQLNETQDLQKELVKLTSQSTSLNSEEVSILKQLHKENVQRIQDLSVIQENPNLQVFFRRLQIRLEELFLAHKARAPGLMTVSLSKASLISAVCESLGVLIEEIPIIGLIPKIIAKGHLIIAESKAINTSQNTSVLSGTLVELQYLAQSIACYLTLRYQNQIKQLMTQEEVDTYQRKKRQSSTGEKIKQGIMQFIAEGKEEILNSREEPPCIEAAEFLMILILLAFHDGKIKDPEQKEISVEEQIADYLLRPLSAIEGVKDKILSALGMRTVLTKDEQEWNLLEMYHNSNKYGYRLGTDDEIANLRKHKNQRDNSIIIEKINKLETKHKKLKTKIDTIEKNSPLPHRNNTEFSVGNNNQIQIYTKESAQINNSHSASSNNSHILSKKLDDTEGQVIKLTTKVVEHDELINKLKNTSTFFKPPKKRSKENPIIINQGNDLFSSIKQDMISALNTYIDKTEPKKEPLRILFFSFTHRNEQSLKFLDDKMALAQSIIDNIGIAENLKGIKHILEDGIEADAALCRRENTDPNTLTDILRQFLNGRVQRNLKPSLEDSSFSL